MDITVMVTYQISMVGCVAEKMDSIEVPRYE